MPYLETIRQMTQTLDHTFDAACEWANQSEEERSYKPVDGGWSIKGNTRTHHADDTLF